ncbi:ubiquitin-conjugating enzyme E2 G1 [Dissophora globulifera]|uniref:E2 ubiquitin-conjugating enzyme n=1 Tax=Dissophora globulifera TaxID=979702 RepID=A0A9P6V0M8_9FUNG|nr:ubiquitin-conjugating enzyme E2 G1 [Dissophora globulifera]KAG0330142.1 ubiquitin-conjugating enzyme E2 G1 [Dissophora globulifera]
MPEQSALLLRKQLLELTKRPVQGFSAGLVDDSNVLVWEITIMDLQDPLYEGGIFKAELIFDKNYPLVPPEMIFKTKMYHPNVFPDGKVCISILHSPGEDKYGYEQASERWLPVHTVESIVVSVISMLMSPNDESPANVDAAKEWRENYPSYKKKVQRLTRDSADAW